jgi:HEAT repeat protein
MPVKTPIKEALEALIHALEKDPVAEVRETAAMALGKIGPDAQSAIPALAAALKHNDLAVRVAAAESLGLMGTQARTVVTDMVQAYRDNKDVKVRQALTVSFGRLGDGAGAAVGVLSEALTSESNWDDETALEFRRVTAEALGLIGKAEAVEPLARFLTQTLKLERPSESVLRLQRTLMSALTQEPLLKQLDKAVLPVLKDATASRQDKYVRCQAAFALGRLGRFFGDKAREYVGILKDGINDNLNDYRLVSIQALGEVGKEVIGDQLNEVGEKLRIVASSAGQKGLRDAADATLKQLGLK